LPVGDAAGAKHAAPPRAPEDSAMSPQRRPTPADRAAARHARALVDAVYRELEEYRCRRCGRRFRPINNTHHYCRAACAYQALRAREGRR
jgi:hypothetical protein